MPMLKYLSCTKVTMARAVLFIISRVTVKGRAIKVAVTRAKLFGFGIVVIGLVRALLIRLGVQG